MTGAIPVITPAGLKQASRMGEGLLTLYWHYQIKIRIIYIQQDKLATVESQPMENLLPQSPHQRILPIHYPIHP